MTLSVTVSAWEVLAYLVAGVVGYPALVIASRAKMAPPHESWRHEFWPRYHGDTRQKRVRRNLSRIVACVVLWPVAWWEVAR